jgi:hypothetical protein
MRAASPSWGPAARSTLRAVLPHPLLWPIAVATVFRLARPGWWRTWPPVPLPDSRYWHFRLVTAYGGSGDGAPTPEDVVAYLRWCRSARPVRG